MPRKSNSSKSFPRERKPVTRSQTAVLRTYNNWKAELDEIEDFCEACKLLTGDPILSSKGKLLESISANYQKKLANYTLDKDDIINSSDNQLGKEAISKISEEISSPILELGSPECSSTEMGLPMLKTTKSETDVQEMFCTTKSENDVTEILSTTKSENDVLAMLNTESTKDDVPESPSSLEDAMSEQPERRLATNRKYLRKTKFSSESILQSYKRYWWNSARDIRRMVKSRAFLKTFAPIFILVAIFYMSM